MYSQDNIYHHNENKILSSPLIYHGTYQTYQDSIVFQAFTEALLSTHRGVLRTLPNI